jgi:hypothetical protein
VRPIGYFLAIPVAAFMVYAQSSLGLKRALKHSVVFLVLVYSLLGAWQLRNYYCCRESSFSPVVSSNFEQRGILRSVAREGNLFSQTVAVVKVGLRGFFSIMTDPGSLKYFNNKLLTQVGKGLFYPWMFFWFMGFLVGCASLGKDVRYQFLFLVILYFIGATILNIDFIADERFRVPVMPAIAILSAYGWSRIMPWLKRIPAREKQKS